jgi:hypothetical protein
LLDRIQQEVNTKTCLDVQIVDLKIDPSSFSGAAPFGGAQEQEEAARGRGRGGGSPLAGLLDQHAPPTRLGISLLDSYC